MIVVSHGAFNQTAGWRSVIVVPLTTSARQAARGPTVVAVPSGAAGLPREGAAVCHQVTTLDRARLSPPIGSLSSELQARVDEAIEAAMDLR